MEENEEVRSDQDVFKKMRSFVMGSSSAKSEELKFGEQLQDDLINSFCDKLQAACPNKIEALFAIQFVSVSDLDEVRAGISGENDAFQVVYDAHRRHYLLIHFESKERVVHVYDSSQPWHPDGNPAIFPETLSLIIALFGHVFAKDIYIQIDREYEQQKDGFSCGYRVIGAILAAVGGENPARITYSRSRILHLLQSILDEPSPKWEHFEAVKIGREKEYFGSELYEIHVANPVYQSENTESSCSRSSSSLEVCSTYVESMNSLHGQEDLQNMEEIVSKDLAEMEPEKPAAVPMDSAMFNAFRRMFTNFSLFGKGYEAMKID